MFTNIVELMKGMLCLQPEVALPHLRVELLDSLCEVVSVVRNSEVSREGESLVSKLSAYNLYGLYNCYNGTPLLCANRIETIIIIIHCDHCPGLVHVDKQLWPNLVPSLIMGASSLRGVLYTRLH